MGGEILRKAEKDLVKRLKEAGEIIFFLDYDGTLTPIRKRPGLATIGKSEKSLLKKLASKKRARVFIVTGRMVKDIKGLIGLKSLYYAGNHGIELRGPHLNYLNPKAKELRPAIQKAYRTLKEKIKQKGSIVENKIYSLSVHYRMVNPREVPRLRRVFDAAVKALRRSGRVKITEGKKVLEVRPNTKWNKGKIVGWVLKRIRGENTLPVYIGDDKTDEDAFRAIGKKGITVLVSGERKKTRAQYRLSSPKEVMGFLRKLSRELVD